MCIQHSSSECQTCMLHWRCMLCGRQRLLQHDEADMRCMQAA